MFSIKKTVRLLCSWLIFMAGSVYAAPVSVNIAQEVAQNWISERTLIKADMLTVLETFTEFEETLPAYHIINLKPDGWVIVSADDVAYPIIAYSKEGSYSPENRPPAFDEWMAAVKQAIYSAVIAELSPLPKSTDEWLRLTVDPDNFQKITKATTKDVDPPLLNTTWDQDFPYNEQCPIDAAVPGGRAVTGCVATAMAQIMRYHEYPTTGYGSHSYVPETHPEYGEQSADFGATTYDWAAMPDSPPDTSNPELARLLYHCGVSVDMDYAPPLSVPAPIWEIMLQVH